MYSNTLVHLKCFKNLERGFSLSSMATVVDLSKGNSYKLLALMTSLFVWCMSGAPRAFDGKMCAHHELIRVVHHVWLMVN